MRQVEVKLRAGRYRVPVTLSYNDEGRIFVKFGFNRKLITEVKSMEGAKWHGFEDPPRKVWSIADSHRNAFQLQYLQGLDPYQRYDAEIIDHKYIRSLYDHQKEFSDFILTIRQCIIAGEMGTGKTLAAIEVMERSGFRGAEWWYVAPKSGIRAVQREIRIWKSMVFPNMMTYEALTKTMKNWENGTKAPKGVFFDESARAKNPTAQRSQAAKMLADGIRDDWGHDGYIVLMSGAPAPKSPADWWHQCEVACPGYLKEGDQMKFKKRLAVVVQKQSDMAGGVYPHLETWRDDSKKCHVCGKYADDDMHKVDPMSLMTGDSANDRHPFQASKDEVSYLYKRMKGLVLVRFKKDCLDLPDKQFRLVNLEPSQKIMNVARSLISQSSTVIGGITAVRELSDGFQYRKEVCGTEKCPVCQGKKRVPNPINEDELVDCDGCGGQGERDKYKRIAEQIDCPKDEVIRDLLDELSDVGRIVVFAGFTGSVDRCVQTCQDYNWETIRVDGRGWHSRLEGDPLDIFQDQQNKHPRVAFVGHPEAGGIGLTLTASPMIAYYSNDFKFENRVQSMDRIHRPGMDYNRGATIVDIVHLPTDQLILDNLDQKRRLQALTMGVLKDSLGDV